MPKCQAEPTITRQAGNFIPPAINIKISKPDPGIEVPNTLQKGIRVFCHLVAILFICDDQFSLQEVLLDKLKYFFNISSEYPD